MENNKLGRELSHIAWEHYGGRAERQLVKEALAKLGIKAELINKLARKITTYAGACWLGAATAKHYDDQQLIQALENHCMNRPPSRWVNPS